ncbi:hypothetical protein Golomagni_07228, partial [Golovinomyces magnicellulatus]
DADWFLAHGTATNSASGDVGGQKTLRSYWRNYFEKTDALIWVVDSTDRLRIDDCREELAGLLQEERLGGASLLIFANKTDVQGCMTEQEIVAVSYATFTSLGIEVEGHSNAPMANFTVQCYDGKEPERRTGLGCGRGKEEVILVLNIQHYNELRHTYQCEGCMTSHQTRMAWRL